MNPPSNPKEILNYLDNLNIEDQVNNYFILNDNNKTGYVDANEYKYIFIELNKKVGIQQELLGEKEWAWTLNLINKKIGDLINKEEAIKLYQQMINIARDYLYCLPKNKNINNTGIESKENNLFKLVKKHIFEADAINGKSINTLIDINDNFFIATIGLKGKIIIDKKNFEVISYKKDFGFYISCKFSSYILLANNSNDKECSLFYSDINLKKINPIEMDEKHKGWISKIIKISNNKIATSSGDKTIKIWEIISINKIKIIKTLSRHTSDVISIIKIKNKDLLISASYDNMIIIWDLTTYSILKEINNVQCCFINGMKELSNERIVVSDGDSITIINYITGEIITKVDIKIKGSCFEIIKDTLLIGCFDGSYKEMNLNNYKVELKKEKETNYNSSFLKLPNNILIVGLHNGILKIYKY